MVAQYAAKSQNGVLDKFSRFRGFLMSIGMDASLGRGLPNWVAVYFFFVVILAPVANSLAAEPKAYSSYDDQIRPLLDEMTLEEKVGQMTQAELGYLKDHPGDIQKYHIGSVLSGGGSDPAEGNGLTAWTDAYDNCQKQALESRLGIPILYGIDGVHGHNNVIGAVIFPHHIGLGCTRDPQIVEEVGRVTAKEIRATGIQWTFAPCVTVPRDERWGRTYEGFSEDPDVVAELGEAMTRGLQGERLREPLSVVACVKHFVGDGGTSAQTGEYQQGTTSFGNEGNSDDVKMKLDQGNTQVDEATLRSIHLAPYLPSIEAGVGTVMPSYSRWNGVKCSASKFLLTDVLKNELGFQGFLISDYNAIDQIDPDYKKAVEISINAGMDMAMAPNTYKAFYESLIELVKEGRVPQNRIDDAVTRILRVKAAAGLLDKDRSQLADRSLHTSFGSPEHRAVAREAVRKSLVLLKNEDDLLPLARSAGRIHVAGKNADDVGNQCGGWTIQWQGESGDVTEGTTILEAIEDTVGDDAKVTFAIDGSGAAGADVGVLVIGEPPYAEGNGDTAELALASEDVAAFKKMKEADIPIVVVLVTGRPLMLDPILDDADAIVAAWLPGTEGQGVADVLFGDYAPTGKLSFTWPKSVKQIPINVGDEEYAPQFAFGFGLSYAEEPVTTAATGGN
jgi:beta-glucosidase